MKKHSTKQALEVFKQMFEGWSVVTNKGEKFQIEAIDLIDGRYRSLADDGCWKYQSEISHIEQTLPMNGDRVFGNNKYKDIKGMYIGKQKDGRHMVQRHSDESVWICDEVELLSKPRQITIEEATELLKKGEKIEEQFEIVKP